MKRPLPSQPNRALLALCAFLSPVIAAAQQPAAAPDYSREAVVVERISARRHMEMDGRGVYERRVRVRIQSDAGVQGFGELEFSYNAASEHIVVASVVVHKADGRVVTAGPDAVQDRTDPVEQDAPVFTDYRKKVVTVPALQPGDTLEFATIDSIVSPMAPGHSFFNYSFDTASVVLSESLTVDVPAALRLKVKSGPSAPAADSGVANGLRWFRWVTSHTSVKNPDQPVSTRRRLFADPPSVQATTFRSWDELAKWYDSLAAPRASVTPPVLAEAQTLTAGLRDDSARVRALYDFVATHIRYVSLSFGLGRYQPHAAADVLANQYGDCKDKHTLLAALLDAVHIKVDPVLISTTQPLDADFPSPLQFDHLISLVHIGRDSLWLDTTPGVAPFRLLTFTLRDRGTLAITPAGGARLLRTPAEPPTPNLQRVVTQGSVDPLGGLAARTEMTLRGDAEVAVRGIFRRMSQAMWAPMMRGVAQQSAFGAKVDSVTASDPTATAKPFVINFKFSKPGFFEIGNRQGSVRLPLTSIDLPSSEVQYLPDTTVMALDLPGDQIDSMVLVIPAGYQVHLPVPIALKRDYAEYASSYVARGDTIIASRSVHFLQHRIPRSRSQDLDAFRRAVGQDQAQMATFERGEAIDSVATLPAAPAQDLYDAGVAAYRRFNYSLAARLVRAAVTADTGKHASWKVDLANAYLDLHLPDSAEHAARLALQDDPYVKNGQNDLGLALWGERRYTEAAEAFNREIEASPLEDWVFENMGRMYAEQHLDSLALVAFQAEARIRSRNSSLQLHLGEEYLALHQPDLAAAHFDTATDLSRGSMWNDIAYAYAQANTRLDRALTYVDRALDATYSTLKSADPAHPNFQTRSEVRSLAADWDTKGWIAFQQGDLATADRFVRSAWALGQHAEVGDHLAQIALRRGDRSAAARLFAQAEAAVPPYNPTYAHVSATPGLQADVDRETPHAKADLEAARTVSLGPDSGLVGSAQFDITLDQSGHARGVQFSTGDHRLEAIASRLQHASYPVVVPDTTTFFLPRRGTVTCVASGCSVMLQDPDWVPFIGPAGN